MYLYVKTISLPQGLTSIGRCAFDNFVNLKSITIPDSVTSIGYQAFNRCSYLTSVTIPEGVTIISAYAFAYCEKLESITLPDSVTSIGDWGFTCCSNLTSVTFGDGITKIGARAFDDCRKLTNITIPDSVTSIGDYAFCNCESFTSITIPDSVTNIGYRVFHSCDSLASITVDPKNTAYSNDEYGVLFNKDKTTLIHYPVAATRTSYVIPDSVTSTSNFAFANCLSLESITIGNNLKNIGDRAFVNCENLKSIIISDGVTKIGDYTFSNCKSLTSITIPKTVKKIGYSVFNGCQSLADVYYTGTEEEWNAISIGVSNENLLKATIHYCYGCEHSYVSEVTTEATCTENGVETFTCNKCGDVYTESIPENGHTHGEWEIVIEPTTETEGKKTKKCLACGETVEEEIIPKNTVLTDEKTGIEVEINGDDYDGETKVVVEEAFDDSVFNIVNAETDAVQTTIFDIKITVNGEETQPKGTVKVRIPLPEGYNPLYTFVYHVDTVKGTKESMNAVVETINGKEYVVFETTHFSYYAIVEEISVEAEIRNPSAATIKYGDTIVLHADLNVALPNNWHVEWTASNDSFDCAVSADGLTCTITPSKSGDTTFTATVYDEDGNVVSADEQTMTSKAGFFDKILAFFKKLFGLTKTIPELYKGIY